MIITVTFNPSLDYIYLLDNFELGKNNRANNPVMMVGGKGINSGRASQLFGGNVLNIAVLGGMTGEIIKKLLLKEQVVLDYVEVEENNRNAITIMHNENRHTELVEKGINITPEIGAKVLMKIIKAIESTSELEPITLSIAGSINSTTETIYSEIISYINNHYPNIPIVADVSGIQLDKLYFSDLNIELMKPNIHEYSELVGRNFETKKELLKYLQDTEAKGQKNILISCGHSGAVYLGKDGSIVDFEVPIIEAVNTTGCGDSTVGGILYGYNTNFGDKIDILRLGNAFGVSNALNEGVGEIKKEEVYKYLSEIKYTRLK